MMTKIVGSSISKIENDAKIRVRKGLVRHAVEGWYISNKRHYQCMPILRARCNTPLEQRMMLRRLNELKSKKRAVFVHLHKYQNISKTFPKQGTIHDP
mmetsp:Transcript_21631/g.49208  ORF Transcript_21631/g.49208 Transcript_21631/m.49208 type:complete len:98 (+) Transcript_21631:153-446(+)